MGDEDCYYFLYSTCTKRERGKCSFRHSPRSIASNKACNVWLSGRKCPEDCGDRHSFYHLQKKRDEIDCYWEVRGGCKKENCPFRHRGARPAADEIPALEEKAPAFEEAHKLHKFPVAHKQEAEDGEPRGELEIERSIRELESGLQELERFLATRETSWSSRGP